MSAKQDSPSNRRFDSRVVFVTVAGLVLGTAGLARADEPAAGPPAAAEAPSPKNYITGVIGTTLFFRANGGSFAGLQKDINPAAGYGRYVTPTIAVELDAGLSFTSSGDYALFYLVPGVVWSFSTHFYAAMRLVVPLDPEVNLTLYPGFGGYYGFDNGLGFSLELNPSSTIGRGKPDFGTALNLGILYSF